MERGSGFTHILFLCKIWQTHFAVRGLHQSNCRTWVISKHIALSSRQHTYMRQDNLRARDVMLNKNTHAQQSVQLWWLGPDGWCRLCRKLVTAKERRLPHNDECVYAYMLCLQFTCVLQSDWCNGWITKVRSCTELLYKWSQTLLPWVEGLARQTNMVIIETYPLWPVCRLAKCTTFQMGDP